MKTIITIYLVQFLFALFLIVGEIKCIYKAVKCDWEAPYRAEVIYTASACSGLGSFVGWFNIDDKKTVR